MNALTLQWHDAGQERTQTIYENQPSKNYGTVRIGRDPSRCDIVLTNPTVSGLHVEIFFSHQYQQFMIRNLRSQNPPLVNGQRLVQGELPIHQGSTFLLGDASIHVFAVSITSSNSIPATILAIPEPGQNQNHQHSHPALQSQGTYGLECPKCHRVSSIEHLQVGCPWCGTSLAAAVSVLVSPDTQPES
ncbi:FHA domain-containing protein [Calothrix sp. NIES-3974]|uniref:FHA domain-containing protein n=1 Tax=Calothrix sp. NIES-3974 TaxID=2005462 RepID=UPI000B5E6F55|nr:FHA domain-containing protein [Calothrix sp. NIES-3974]BAZ06405.1 FHA domain containing protein [Calothrix sp. NIES-3974]